LNSADLRTGSKSFKRSSIRIAAQTPWETRKPIENDLRAAGGGFEAAALYAFG